MTLTVGQLLAQRLLSVTMDEDPENFSGEAKKIALDVALELGEDECQTLYHFAVMVARMAR
jgi:hypothetical protein